MSSANEHIHVSDSTDGPVVIPGATAEIKLGAPVGTLIIEKGTEVNPSVDDRAAMSQRQSQRSLYLLAIEGCGEGTYHVEVVGSDVRDSGMGELDDGLLHVAQTIADDVRP
jgi:hypothetical protein